MIIMIIFVYILEEKSCQCTATRLSYCQCLRLSLLLGDSRYIEKKLSECTRKNDEFNSLAKMTNSINCTKFRNKLNSTITKLTVVESVLNPKQKYRWVLRPNHYRSVLNPKYCRWVFNRFSFCFHLFFSLINARHQICHSSFLRVHSNSFSLVFFPM